ncbi:MAG: type I-E CRISPR-associated protein Cas6/Cse3/CasE [bacterium]
MADTRLHLVRMAFETPRLLALGRARRLPIHETDLGYLVHCAMGEIFGDDSPSPFAITGAKGRHQEVLAYSSLGASELRLGAERYAAPEAHACCDWEAFAAKPMPGDWHQGERLGFGLRACPVVRMASAGTHHRKGAEVDAFLARCWAEPEGSRVDRETVYRDWLSSQLDRHGGATLRACQVRGFQRSRLLRRSHGGDRRSHFVERTAVDFQGEIEVRDPAQFGALLARGVGRHRGFGFGMLLLRRLPRT